MVDSYVIGLTPHNLIDIEFGFDWGKGTASIRSITHGFRNVDEATIIGGLDNAKSVLKEIQDRYNEIGCYARTVLESLIDGNDINPIKLHIYEVRVGWEVI